MFKTIAVGSCVLFQGLVVVQWPDGRVTIRIDDRTYTGYPVDHNLAAQGFRVDSLQSDSD